MIKVSIIVPVYNTASYLRRCLNSLCEQTLKEIEIILVNDGSTDQSAEIMDAFKAKYPEKIKIFEKENGGQATARNMGILNASGKYIGFADSDDYVDTDIFEKMYDIAEKRNADYAECNYHCIYECNNRTKEIRTRGRIRQYKNQRDMLIDPQVSPWNKLYRKDIMQDEKVLFPEGVIYEDTAFYIKMIPHIKNPVYLDEKLVYYCVRENSTMTCNKNIKVADIFVVLQNILDYYKENGYEDAYKKELTYFCTKILFCSSLGRIGRIPDKELRKELIEHTFDFVDTKFPEYMDNPLFGGKTGMYIKLLRRYNAGIAARILGNIMKG